MKFQSHNYTNLYPMMYFTKWKRATILLLVVWLAVTYFISPLKCNGSNEELLVYKERLRQVSAQLDTLRHQHSNLITQIRKSSGETINMDNFDGGSIIFDGTMTPSEEYEDLRRKIYSNMKEFWYFINHQLTKAIGMPNNGDVLQEVLEQAADRKRILLSDMEKLPEKDGYAEWRRGEAANVSDLIQRRLKHLQNPPDCREARKVICNLNKGCGFGCQVHHLVYCLIFAYATERTLIVNSKGWRYNNKGMDYIFEPLSDTCTTTYDDKVLQWPVTFDARVVTLPFVDSMSRRPKFLPLAVPKDLANRILRFNGDPASWWIGQMLKYILKPQPLMQKAINETGVKMKFKNPIVGVHIRRTDKVGTEAAFHHIDEYMQHVAEYYDRLELTRAVDMRRVYLASDDANVLEEARSKYPQYEFFGDASISKSAATHRRYTPVSLTGLLVDLNMLAMSDYLVCTFSSQIGRLAYEMMQANRVDASDSYFTLDDIYYFGGQNPHDRVAILAHKGGKNEEIAFEVGDTIGIAGNHWNGFGVGTNKKTNQHGMIPWYKTTDQLVLYPFPEYKEVPLFLNQKHKMDP